MTTPNFVMSIEEECLSVVERGPEGAGTLGRFLTVLSGLAPSLPGTSGFHNAYGRVYEDLGGHIEFAALECDSPLALVGALETQYALAARAAAEVRGEGLKLRLGGTKHSGLLQPDTAVWGLHENYLIEEPAQALAARMLPFLATRLYAGTGGIVFPSGDYVASVRILFMEQDTGGNTTGCRALFSTSREEHHMGPRPRFRRLHLICGDAHKSQFNLALVLGATALALKAVQHEPALLERVLAVLRPGHEESWASVSKRLNRLGSAEDSPRVAPEALAVQRLYLEAAERYSATLSVEERPSWIALVLTAWRQTLTALEQGDRDWLGRRLDLFIKRDYLEACLARQGLGWRDLAGNKQAFCELALHDQAYHALDEQDSLFERLERLAELEQRLVPRVEAGQEREPFVPPVATRARARARFLREHTGQREFLMEWDSVLDRKHGRIARLHDPFATEYSAWAEVSPDDLPLGLRRIFPSP